ncbi:GrdX family protein [Clostridium cylindrosporum]|uniref:GrdX family protein n=1 Tax=Clostridium cylindrosporum TaxID=1495 RepID=UPI00065C6910|nr:GrdX family protein [Clostridium cylindrosporum]
MEKVVIEPKVITNNKITYENLKVHFDVEFIDGSLSDVMIKARDYIHKGHKLLTHPLMGSIKPNETPYKSVAISLKPEVSVDFNSVMLIENSIETSNKLIRNKAPRQWPQSVLEDFSIIDYDLIKNALI